MLQCITTHHNVCYGRKIMYFGSWCEPVYQGNMLKSTNYCNVLKKNKFQYTSTQVILECIIDLRSILILSQMQAECTWKHATFFNDTSLKSEHTGFEHGSLCSHHTPCWLLNRSVNQPVPWMWGEGRRHFKSQLLPTTVDAVLVGNKATTLYDV